MICHSILYVNVIVEDVNVLVSVQVEDVNVLVTV